MENKPRLKTQLAALALAFTAIVPSLHAQLTLPTTDVSDGALNITNSGVTSIDLTLATYGISWTNNNAGNAGHGVYDPAQWAVVFKYSSVYIASNATVTFINNQTHAPVVWLVNGNVTINGTVNLDGQAGNNTDSQNLAEPGPGGFRGGGGPVYGYGPGFGPGGGSGPGYSGNYAATIYSYGNPQILPLIGGSGGSGAGAVNGCGGGGAILIAVTGTMNLTNGNLHATGGYNSGTTGSGSGGGIRLVAYQISGNASTSITALGGNNDTTIEGRIRLEANSVNGSPITKPATQVVSPDSPVIKIFPATNAPTVTIVNVGTMPVSADPKAIMSSGVNADDVTLVTTNVVTILLQTQNFPTNGMVTVYIKPRNNNSPETILPPATFDNGTTNLANWHVNTTLLYPGNAAHTVIQARATF